MYDSIDINEIDQIHITSLNTHDSNQRILIDIRDKDVYKRQEVILEMVIKLLPSTLKMNFMKWLIAMEAVSYTHLDVYKRQS